MTLQDRFLGKENKKGAHSSRRNLIQKRTNYTHAFINAHSTLGILLMGMYMRMT